MFPISLELQVPQVNFNTRKDFKSLGIASLYGKQFLISNEVKASLILILSLQTLCKVLKVCFRYGVTGCRYMII